MQAKGIKLSSTRHHKVGENLASRVINLSGQNVHLCYQCHKCAAGCPVIDAMSFGPERILRLIALDQEQAVLSSRDIWLCAGCYTCWTRCPNEINISSVMDALRQIAIRDGYPAGESDAFLFHRLFLIVIKYLGRSHEAIMLGTFKVISRVPFTNDLQAGLGLFLRRKIPILPGNSRAVREVRRIYQRSK